MIDARAVVVSVSALGAIGPSGCGSQDVRDEAALAEPAVTEAPAPTELAPPGPDHSVFSLIDNRLLAHSQRHGGIVVPAGSAGAAKYLRFDKAAVPFELGQDRDGVSVARFVGRSAAVVVPLTAEQASSARHVRVRHFNVEARSVTVRVNGTQLQTVDVPAGWATSELAVPTDVLAAGEAEVELLPSPGTPMELAWVQLGGIESPDAISPIYDPATKSLVLDRSGGVAFYVMVPDGAFVTGDVARAPCKVAVSAQPDGGPAVSGVLEGARDRMALDAVAGQVVRLELRAQGCPTARLANASLSVDGVAPAVPAGLGPKPTYIVFWIMDSLRADRVRTFVPAARPEVPAFDALGATSAVFTQAYVQGNESRVSHASMWSALYPVVHNMLDRKAKLAAKWITLDEVVTGAGMYASGVSGNGYVAKKWGFGTAWDAFANHIHDRAGLRGESIYANAIESVEGRSDPWFLYIGTIDTHVSWRAKKPWIDQYDPDPYRGPYKKLASGRAMGKVAGGKLKPSKRDWQRIRALYDSNVSYQDDLLRQLLEQLDAWGVRDQTMIIITADHGDELWEHRRVGHGGSLRDSVVHVPLLVHYPPLIPAGKIAEGVEVVDIVPTIAAALGVAPDAQWQGESLVPLAHGVGRGYPRMSMASMYERSHAGRIGPWKLVVSGGKSAQLFNVADDPGERVDRADAAPYARQFASDALWMLRVYNARWKKSHWGNAANASPRFAVDVGG